MSQTASAKSPATRAESKEALLTAAQAAVDDAKRKAASERRQTRHSSRVVLLVAAGALFALSIYLLAVRPSWFFTPPLPPDPPDVREASLRLTLAREAERVRQFHVAHGRLPETLAEAGAAVKGLEYEVRPDGTFAVRAPLGVSTLELRSTDQVDRFLGDSWQTIMNQGR